MKEFKIIFFSAVRENIDKQNPKKSNNPDFLEMLDRTLVYMPMKSFNHRVLRINIFSKLFSSGFNQVWRYIKFKHVDTPFLIESVAFLFLEFIKKSIKNSNYLTFLFKIRGHYV